MMIRKRPTLPIGHVVADLAPVTRVILADARCELYSLSGDGGSDSILFLGPCPDGRAAELDRLTDWWRAQPSHVLASFEVLSESDTPNGMVAAALALRGRRLGSDRLTEADEATLIRVLVAMLERIRGGEILQAFPDFDPSLLWLSADGREICAIRSLNGLFPSEADQVRAVASSFYFIATGVDAEKVVGPVPPMIRWSKFAGEELSGVVDRCLSPRDAKVAIATVSGLRRALGMEQSGVSNVPGSSPLAGIAAVSGSKGVGLDKVAGMHALKELLRREVVDPIRTPEPFERYGLSIPNGVLLYGPPGCGKTYIARQLAEELGHYFVEVIPSELASPYIHQSVIRIRELFDAAAENAPAVMFIDEFEALVPLRSELGGSQQYKSEEVNEFLAHLNDCAKKRIFVIAATNQPEKIDPAVRRTGRLDKLIYVGPPDAEARREMLGLHLRGRPLAADCDLAPLADELGGYSASDIRFLVDEAARDAMRGGQEIIRDSFRTAMTRVRPSVTAQVEEQYQSIEQRGL